MPQTLQLEPPSARDYCINLVRDRQQFAVEIDPQLIKDMCIVHRGAVLESRAGWTHLRQRATSLDDACHFVVNLIKSELSFQCNPEHVTDHTEWLFLVELRSSGRKE